MTMRGASNLTLITSSVGKTREIDRILGFSLPQISLELPEIQAVELEDVIAHKARQAYEILDRRPIVVEDTGLFIDAWNGLPGALVKWFLQRVGVDGICRMLDGHPNRAATAKTLVAVFDGNLHLFEGGVRGTIADAPIGNSSFGFDPIFIPAGTSQTFASMTGAAKDKLSMRRIAFERMEAHYTRRSSSAPGGS